MKQLAGQESEKAYNPCRILNISRFGKQNRLEFSLDFINSSGPWSEKIWNSLDFCNLFCTQVSTDGSAVFLKKYPRQFPYGFSLISVDALTISVNLCGGRSTSGGGLLRP